MAAFGKEWEQSNEELAVKAQAGDAQSMERLFLQVRRLIFHDLRKYRWALTRDRAIDWDDLEQAGAEGFLYAVEKYRPEEGTKFSTVLGFGIKHKLRYLLQLGSAPGRKWRGRWTNFRGRRPPPCVWSVWIIRRQAGVMIKSW